MEVKAYQKYLLYSVISLTVLLRFYHKYQWPIWGSDSGEYLYLTRHLINEGMMLNENYIAWLQLAVIDPLKGILSAAKN